MKIELTEYNLKINSKKCSSITIFKRPSGIFEVEAFDVEGWTFKKEIISRYGVKKIVTMRKRKKIKSKNLDYAGISLEEMKYTSMAYKKYCFARNKLGNYVNYYE